MKIVTTIGSAFVALALSSVPSNANLLINGDFNTGDFTGWYTYVADATMANTIDTTLTYDATPNAMMVSGDTTWRDAIGQSVSIGPNTQYQLSFVYNSDAPSTEYGNVFAVSINYYDASSTYLNYEWDPNVINTSGSWATYSATFTTPANTASLNLEFDLYNSATVHLDNVVLQAVPEPTSGLFLLVGGLVTAGFLRRRAQI